MPEKLSAVIITKNEAANIDRCLRSLSWVDEIIVLDSGSTDETVSICSRYNCKIISTEWQGFGKTKKKAVELASHDWILSVDSDEEITPELRSRIRKVLEKPQYDGYRIRRRSFYLGYQVRFCGWQNDAPLRLFNRMKGNFNEKEVHESVEIGGATGFLKEPVLHYPYPTIRSHYEKMLRYAELSARSSLRWGKSATITGAFFRGFFKFFKMYILQLGFLDGKFGFLLCMNSGIGVFLKRMKLWELNRKHPVT